jgi:integrase
MTRLELDLAREWKLLGNRTKDSRAHNVLGDAGNRPRLFLAADATRQVTYAALHIAHFTPHDLRRTAHDAMATLGIAPHVVAAVANHVAVTKSSVTTRHYVQYDYSREKREALDRWADRLKAIVAGKPIADVALLRGVR